jgi:hypothetical protein
MFKKNFFLGKFKVDFFNIDLSQLINKLYLTVSYTITHNKYAVKLNVLINSKANGFVFINTLYTINITKFLNVKAQHLSCLINIKDYNRKTKSVITHIL